MLEQLRQWLEGWPGWGRAPDIAIDGLELAGSAVSLRPGGAAESRFREDILGGGELSTSYRFWLELRLEKPPATWPRACRTRFCCWPCRTG